MQNVIEIIHRGIHQAFTNVYPSIITVNVNELNSPIKRHRLAEWIQK